MAKTKPELIAELTARGAALTGDETVADLTRKLKELPAPDAPAPLDGTTSEAAPAQPAPAAPATGENTDGEANVPAETPKAVKGVVTVKYRGEDRLPTSREYSKEVHGPDFEKLAKQFAENMASQNRLIA